MNPNQYGFTPKKNATDATLAIKEYIEEGMREGHIEILVSLDIKGAFDAAWWPSILNTLKEFNCPKILYNLAKSYFGGRTAILNTNSIQMEKEVSKGCAQGSCCGPGFWNMQYNSLLNREYGKRTKAIAFVDDLLIAITAETVPEAENRANIEIRKISNWAKENKITFNKQKSKVMVISRRKRRENEDVSIYLNNKFLEQVKTIKYLGIIIESKLKFREHLIYTSTKCSKLIHALSKSAKLRWGIKHEALNTINKGDILPLMLYGVPVWIGAMAKKCNKILYTRVQRLMNIKIAKAYRTTSGEAVGVLTGITPIEIKVAETDRLYRITRDRQNRQLDHEEEPKDCTHPADSVRISEQGQEEGYTIHIHTDGSKNEHGIGSRSAIQGVPRVKVTTSGECSLC
jgi:hypothetical protein